MNKFERMERFKWVIGENLCADPEICAGCGHKIGYMETATLYEDFKISKVLCEKCAEEFEKELE